MLAHLLIAILRLYQRTLSRLLGNVCRFEPSCSRYAVACIQMHGAGRGSFLSMIRLCKCHPFHPGGFDPPPARPSSRFPRMRTFGKCASLDSSRPDSSHQKPPENSTASSTKGLMVPSPANASGQ